MIGAYPAVDNIVSNPPFGLCTPKRGETGFVERCLAVARCKVALLLPVTWGLGDRRSRWLENTPLKRVRLLTPRPSMPPGHLFVDGFEPGQGWQDFAWFVWERGYQGPPHIHWLRREDAA